ncbi:MAG TPA: hypothetical protein VK943_08665 [Arenibaculum sp.]|nr:hypothetical protein [Arenibaculum sp.]
MQNDISEIDLLDTFALERWARRERDRAVAGFLSASARSLFAVFARKPAKAEARHFIRRAA